jgi:hypothetical protein
MIEVIIVVAFISEWDNGGITAGIFLASILLKEMRYIVYICTVTV